MIRNHFHNGRKAKANPFDENLTALQSTGREFGNSRGDLVSSTPVAYIVVDESGEPCDVASYTRFHDALNSAAMLTKMTGHKYTVRAGRKTLWTIRNARKQ